MSQRVIVTRPEHDAGAWVAQLQQSGFKAQSLPEAAVSANKARGDTQRFIAVSVARALPTNSIATTAAQPRCRLILAPGVGLEISELPDPNWLIALQRAAQGGR